LFVFLKYHQVFEDGATKDEEPHRATLPTEPGDSIIAPNKPGAANATKASPPQGDEFEALAERFAALKKR
jgi:hypothetical protein